MTSFSQASALIAEDEPVLAAMLAHTLVRLWPNLQLLGIAVNGDDAVEKAQTLKPDILFLDIKMPGKTGLEAAHELVEEWDCARPFPLIVFVTAYDEYALQAFDLAAVDYVLKPINDSRLQRAIERLQQRLASRHHLTKQETNAAQLDPTLAQLVQSLQSLMPSVTPSNDYLRFVRAAIGSQVKMIAIGDVIYFEATDKYVNVVSRDGEALIRTSLRELLPQLDATIFWQIHRGTIVNSEFVESSQRDELGKTTLKLRGHHATLRVSPMYAHLFKQM